MEYMYSCIITSKSIHWLRQRSRLKVILFLALATILEHSCEIILKSVHWLRRRSRLKFCSIFSSGGHFF